MPDSRRGTIGAVWSHRRPFLNGAKTGPAHRPYFWGDLGVGTRQSLGESGGWYAKETPGGGAGGDIGRRRGRLAWVARGDPSGHFGSGENIRR